MKEPSLEGNTDEGKKEKKGRKKERALLFPTLTGNSFIYRTILYSFSPALQTKQKGSLVEAAQITFKNDRMF